MKQIKVFLRRGIALLLSLIMLCTGMDLTAFSSFAAGVSDSSTGTNYANTLEGWHVSTLWSSTLTTDCTWNSVKREEPKQFTLQTTYRIEHPTRDYQPGEIVFRIPGIGNANRDCLVGAYSISAHEKSDHDRASDDDEWEYEWDQASDTYIFYNLFEVKQGVSTSGGFEIVFNLNSRDTENGYYQSKSPTFTLNGDDGATTITMPPLTFSYSSIRDLYYLTLTKSISGDEKESLDDAYIWKKYRTVFSLTEKSRGLYKSSYYVDITLPAGMSEEDVSVLSLSGNSYPITKTQDENGNTVYRFYPFEERYGDVSTYNYNNNEYFYLGIKKERIGQVISLHGHYDRMYKDEQTWVTTSLGDNDNVDVYDSFTLEDYGFHYEGYIYSVDKWTNGGYERQNTIDDHEAPEDPNRLLSSRLYENELVEFNVQGGARRDYGTGSSGTVISRIGNAQQATDTPAIEDHTGMTHAQIYGTTAYGGNTSDSSEIAEDGVYSMVLGDERMTIELSDGSARELRDDEYDIAYVTMPATSGTYYSYDVFGMNAKDNPSASNGTSYFDSFVCLASSNTSSTRTFRLPAGYTNVFVRINGITGSFYYTARFKMRFHVENLEGEKEIDPDGKIVNFSYLRAPHTDANGKDKNDTHVKSGDYDEGYCQNVLAGKDLANYGEYLMRDWSCVWLRSAITELSASAAIEGDDGSASNGYDVTITAAGTIKGDTEGPLNRFSLYSKIPDGFQFDIDELNLTFSGIGYYLDGTRADLDFADHVTYSTVEKDGHTWLVADFDFSDDPLLASKRTELKLVYPIHMSAMDYIEHGNNYDTTTYLMVHDDGCNISGKTVVKDGKTVGGLTSDLLDMDGDKDTEELIAYGNANKVYLETAQHWREFVSKYVKTYYTGGYATEGAVRRTESGMTDEREKQSAYTYRLDFGLGSSCAKDIWFFDSLEQGAMIAKNEDSPYIYDGIGSAWQGTFQSVDTSYAESKKMKPTVYYKLGAVYHFTDGTSLDLTGQDEKSPFEISAELGSDGTLADGWKEMDKDETTCLWTIPSADQAAAEKSGLSIAIHFDTSQMDNGMLQVKEQTYAYINMLATDDEQYDETKAVNQYYVQYVAYTGINDDNPKKTDSLPSSETYVEPMEDVGKIILDKVDGDYYTIVKGEKHYPNLTDAKFTVYRIPDAETDPSGNLTPFTNEDGSVVYLDYNNKTVVNEVNEKEVNVVGRIVIKNLSGGYYMYEETQVPVGYLAPELTEAERTFHLTGSTESGTIHIYNKRMPTKVTLRKDDKDWEEYDFIPGAEYTLTTYAGVPVYADPVSDGVYQYTENPVNNQSTDQYTTRSAAENAAEKKTGAKGTITIYGLPWGTYLFKETKAPEGYELSPDSIKFTVNRMDSEVEEGSDVYLQQHLEVEDEEKTASVILTKTDATSGAPLKNTYYNLEREEPSGSGNWVIARTKDELEIEAYRTNVTGELKIDNLLFGNYRFVETQPSPGYLKPKDPYVPFTLDASTAETVQKVSQTNENILGQMNIRKISESGSILSGAAFQLYRKGTGEEGDERICTNANYKVSKDGTIDTFITDEEGITPTISGLAWGDYYVKETSAPKGYELDTDQQFAFTIDQNNASESAAETVVIVDKRKRGSVLLTKKDEQGNAIGEKAEDPDYDYEAEFHLYTTTGKLVGYSEIDEETGAYVIEEETDKNGDGEINADDNNNPLHTFKTDKNGQILVTGIDWGSYYFLETKAPSGFGISSDYVRFSVNQSNASACQVVECIDKESSAKLVIQKKINDWYEKFGSPTFVFRIQGTDIKGEEHSYVRALTIGKEKEGSVNLEIPEGTYSIEEQTASRYTFQTVTGTGTNPVTTDGMKAWVDLTGGTAANPAQATVVYENDTEQYGRLSHTNTVINPIARSKKLTALSVDYQGPSPITDTTLPEYVFSENDLTATAFYDDNTYEKVAFKDLVLDPAKVTPDDNGGRTIKVSYTENNITVSDSFNVVIDLKETIKVHTITFHAGEGTFTTGLANQISVEWDSDAGANTLKEGIYQIPEHSVKVFAGWCTDEALKNPYTTIGEDGIPTAALTEDLDLYARYVYARITYVRSFEEATDQSQYEAKDWLVTEYTDYVNGVNVLDSGSEEPNAENMKLADGEELGTWYVYDPEQQKITGVLNRNNRLEGNIIAVGSKMRDVVKYAVSIYGIEEDIIEDGDRAGLTFGPATGEDYNVTYRNHTPSETLTEAGNAHRCVHDDDWETIIYWANEDPYVYEECIAAEADDGELYSCTKSIPMRASSREVILTDAHKNSLCDQSEGDGAGTMYGSISEDYKTWNSAEEAIYSGWPGSRIRAVLNGAQEETADGKHNTASYDDKFLAGEDVADLTTEQSLFGAFPTELQAAIQKKKVRSDIYYADAKDITYNIETNDRLWLFSGAELWNSFDGFDEDGFGKAQGRWQALRENEGVGDGKDLATYSRQRLLAIFDTSGSSTDGNENHEKMVAYDDRKGANEEGRATAYGFWLRTLATRDSWYAVVNMSGGYPDDTYSVTSQGIGISPGFCIGDRE